jgi:Putative beta-barrel porin-2, OmpL-like. bbp2
MYFEGEGLEMGIPKKERAAQVVRRPDELLRRSSLQIAVYLLNLLILIGVATLLLQSETQAQTQPSVENVPAANPSPSVTAASAGSSGVAPLGIEYAPGAASVVDSVTDFHRRLQNAIGLQIHGMLVGTYEYNFDRPSTGNNTLRVYDFFGSNSPELAQGELYVERAVANEVGFVLDLNTANVAQVQYGISTVYWKVAGRAGACPQSPCGWLDPTRAYLDYTLPLGNGILITAGTQFPLIGNEAIPSWQNYNLFQSIGYVFHASPFNVTGLRAHYTFDDYLGLTLGLNNGWNSMASSYPLQTFEGQLSLNPLHELSVLVNGMYGPQGATGGNLPSKSGLLDLIATWTPPIDGLSITQEAIVGHQDSDALAPTPIIEGPENPLNPILDEFPNGRTTHPSDWYSEGTWVAYQVTARLQLGLRGEILKDIDGFDTGLPQTLWEITTGFNFKFAEWLVGRFEYRHDESSQKPFPSSKPLVFFPCHGLGTCAATASTYHGMDTILVTLMFIF